MSLTDEDKEWISKRLAMITALGVQATDQRNEVGPDGLPFAGPTAKEGDHGPLWARPEDWTKADYLLNHTACVLDVQKKLAVANSIAKACQKRFGSGPGTITMKKLPPKR